MKEGMFDPTAKRKTTKKKKVEVLPSQTMSSERAESEAVKTAVHPPLFTSQRSILLFFNVVMYALGRFI